MTRNLATYGSSALVNESYIKRFIRTTLVIVVKIDRIQITLADIPPFSYLLDGDSTLSNISMKYDNNNSTGYISIIMFTCNYINLVLALLQITLFDD